MMAVQVVGSLVMRASVTQVYKATRTVAETCNRKEEECCSYHNVNELEINCDGEGGRSSNLPVLQFVNDHISTFVFMMAAKNERSASVDGDEQVEMTWKERQD